MTDPELAILTAAGGTIVAFARWAVGLWATVRREGIEAAKLAAAQTSADSERMVQALIEQARSNAELAGKLEALSDKLDTLLGLRERTPVELPRAAPNGEFGAERPPSDRGRRRAAGERPSGYRPPRPGEHDD